MDDSARLSGAEASAEDVRAAIAAVGRGGRARLLAGLARKFGDLDLAEDMLQEANAQALHTWPRTGVPAVPEAWLMTTAKRKALDVVRRERVLAEKLARLRVEEDLVPIASQLRDPAERAVMGERNAIPDDRLVLFFACAHPVMSQEDRIALTLRFVAGLTTVEVANALLLPVPTMQQRIVRAKKRIRTLGITFAEPRGEELSERLSCVLRVVYLLFSEGYSRSAGTGHIREDLTAEAVRLARVLHSLMPSSAETAGLLGLILLTEARRVARTDAEGRPIPLAEQNRELWDDALLDEGIGLTEFAAADPNAGTYAIQAAIAAVHAEAGQFETTDWAQIAVLYRLLAVHEPGPVVRLGRAVALGRLHGPEIGLRHLDELSGDAGLSRYRPFHISRALTLEELGSAQEAILAYRRALELPGNEAEDGFLMAAVAGLDGTGPSDLPPFAP
ncbi:MAG: RNA polymerase sigma factor [Leucobacter sp.]